MDHLYIQYRDSNGRISSEAKPNSDIVIYDAGQYDNVYVDVGEMRDGTPCLNKAKYWDLDYYEREFDEDKITIIKDSMIDLVTRTFCQENYVILDDDYYSNWNELYVKLRKALDE